MNYQCIIATNGVRTFAVYIYPTGGMVLNSRRQRRRVYMGYNAQDLVHVLNYYESGTRRMASIDTSKSNTGLYSQKSSHQPLTNSNSSSMFQLNYLGY